MTGAAAPKLLPVTEFATDPPKPPNLARAVQGSLFPVRPGNVIPFEQYAPAPVRPKPVTEPRPRAKFGVEHPATAKPSRRASRVPEGQASLEFLPAAPPKPRTLGTTVEAVIYCEAPVATTLHRAVAAAIDWSMVLIAYGLFLLVFKFMGGDFFLGERLNLALFGGVLPVLGFTYGIIFAIAGSETFGMRCTHLRLTTFDGFPPDAKQRILRFAGSCLSLCTVVGLLWSLADEESLNWQDHISRTFPTPHIFESQILQRR
jgi:uncharacterized RDD family membrane protein YckC